MRPRRSRRDAPPAALSTSTLHLHRRRVRVPTYDRRALGGGAVHLGVGGFHRSHQAVYFDDLAAAGASADWGIAGVGLRRRNMRDALRPQDCLFTVVERDARSAAPRVVGALTRYLYAPEKPEAVLRTLADERTRLVMLTVTGDGYDVDPRTLEFDADAPGVRADLANPSRPATPTGYLVEALARRRAAGTPPFTVLSCDNIPSNGRVARTALTSFARLRDEVLARWIDTRVAFPNSMVDRITPQTTAADRAAVRRDFGVDDRWPVMTEPFSQWIIEDRFCNGRPPLDEVGVQFVDDVAPYQLMKNRLLNATHSALGYLGALAGYERTDQVVADPVLERYVVELMATEVAPLIPAVPGIDVEAYQRTLIERFSNPRIADPLARLCGRGSTKMPAYLLPSIVEARAAGRPHALLTLAVAAWFHYLRGRDLSGRPIEVKDALRDELQSAARAGGADPRPLLDRRDLFGALAHDEPFGAEVRQALLALERGGVHGAVESRLASSLAGAA